MEGVIARCILNVIWVILEKMRVILTITMAAKNIQVVAAASKSAKKSIIAVTIAESIAVAGTQNITGT